MVWVFITATPLGSGVWGRALRAWCFTQPVRRNILGNILHCQSKNRKWHFTQLQVLLYLVLFEKIFLVLLSFNTGSTDAIYASCATCILYAVVRGRLFISTFFKKLCFLVKWLIFSQRWNLAFCNDEYENACHPQITLRLTKVRI